MDFRRLSRGALFPARTLSRAGPVGPGALRRRARVGFAGRRGVRAPYGARYDDVALQMRLSSLARAWG